MTEHTLDRALIHHDWDNAHEPVLTIQSGDTVHFDLLMAGHGQVAEDSKIEDVTLGLRHDLQPCRPDPRGGATRRHACRSSPLASRPGPWGWTGLIEGHRAC